jgi:cystathionine beta-lyase/cystathionine gamma-synthase
VDDRLHFETLAARAGAHAPAGEATATVGPLSASTTYTYDSIDRVHAALGPDPDGFAYARNSNPTVAAFEETMAALEGAESVLAFGSGMAAIHAAFLGIGLEAGDSVVVASDLYGVTRSLLSHLMSFEIAARYVDILDLEAVDRALAESHAGILYLETISNPLLRVPDLAACIEIAHRHRARIVVDNTFATPFLLRPIELGADIVVHSATKYIAGHGDVMAGLVASDRSFGKRIGAVRTAMGAVLSPFEAWLALRGLKTLPLRLTRQSESALELARWLDVQPWTERVYYPGLPSHPQHAVARRQFGDLFSGMVAFDLVANRESTLRFVDTLSLIRPATTLGDVVSLVLYPPESSHRTLTPEALREAGIGEGLLRFSVGLENVEDLRNDLQHAAAATLLIGARVS